MEQAVLEILKASPIAGAMLILVIVFLRALDKRDERFDSITKGVIESNTDALKENTGVISQCKFIQKARE
jgi:hypothetical protein